MTLIEKREEVRITLHGSSDIEIDTLTTFLHSIINILKLVSEETIDDGGYRKFLVTNITKGSFVIDLMTVFASNPNLLGTTFSALNAFKTFLDIKKHLKGEKPNGIHVENDKVIIQNCNNSIIIVPQIHFDQMTSQPEIDYNLTKIMQALKKDENRTGVMFEYTNENSDLVDKVELPAEDVPQLVKATDFGDFIEGIEENIMETNITLRKLDFDGTTQWSVYLNGEKENVTITDAEFFKDVKDGKYTFGTHTVLRVIIKVKFMIDSSKNPLPNEKVTYEVVKVISVFTENVERTSILN